MNFIETQFEKKWRVKFLDYFYFYTKAVKFKPLTPENLFVKIFSWIRKNILPSFLAKKRALDKKKTGK